jgi:hypothetical protein
MGYSGTWKFLKCSGDSPWVSRLAHCEIPVANYTRFSQKGETHDQVGLGDFECSFLLVHRESRVLKCSDLQAITFEHTRILAQRLEGRTK